MFVRILSFVVSAAVFSATALAQIGINHTEVVKCTVESVEGSFSSFIPPKVGDTISFDLGAQQLPTLFFDSGAYIPSSPIPNVPNTDPWRSHQAFFTLSPDPIFDNNIQVIVGAYGNLDEPLDQRVWAALIQQYEAPAGGEWGFEQMRLTCQLVKP